MKSHLLLFTICLLWAGKMAAQQSHHYTGTVIDATTQAPIPFASISLKQQLIGIVSNESGVFDLQEPASSSADTVIINAMGYKTRFIATADYTSTQTITLEPNQIELNEVVIRAQPPTYYIKLAMSLKKENTSSKPFMTEGYYREVMKENKHFLRCNEGIFRSYYPNYQDTIGNQHQLMLFRQAETPQEMEFMSKENQKAKEKAIKKGKDPEKASKATIDVQGMFGGPETILKAADIYRDPDAYLDSSRFRDYNYSFAKSSSYNNKELLVIRFDSKGKVDHARSEGTIYIDLATNAIVKVDISGELVIPTLLRPLLFMYGIGVENPTFSATKEYTFVRGKWYPKNFQFTVDLNITRKHWFDPNEHSHFDIESIFTVNKTMLDNAVQIPVDKRFDPKKDMAKQEHQEPGITWDGSNIISK